MRKQAKWLGNRNALGIEKTGGCYLFLGADKLRETGPHSPPNPFTNSPYPTFLLGTCNTHLDEPYVPRIPIRKRQLDTGRLTSFCRLVSAGMRRGLGVGQDTQTCTPQSHQSQKKKLKSYRMRMTDCWIWRFQNKWHYDKQNVDWKLQNLSVLT